MSFQSQNTLLTRLKQSLMEKQFGQKFSEIMSTNIRVNRDDRAQNDINLQGNTILPTISNVKVSLTKRLKSQSAKRISFKPELEKNVNSKSSKKLIQQTSQRQQHGSNKKMDLDGIIIKKQSLLESASNHKQSSIRSKIFSLKTPIKQNDNTHLKDVTQTRDMLSIKNSSNNKIQVQKQIVLKQFTAKLQKISEEMTLMIKLGKIDQQSMDNKKILAYISKSKSSNQEQYIRISKMMDKIVVFIDKYKIQNGTIVFKNVVELSPKKIVSNYQLVNLFVNKSQLIRKYKIIGLNYYTIPEAKGRNQAANKIISLFKMIFSKRFYKKFSSLIGKVKIIQKYWRNALMVKHCRQATIQAINNKINKFKHLQEQFSKNWIIIKTSHRFQIHICSYSLEQFKRMTIKNIKQRQNNQITRIFKALQTDVNILYVAPFQIQEELMKYYQSIFNFSSNKIQQKIYFVVPENTNKFQQYGQLTTASLLLYSPKAMKRIRQIIGKQYAYLVPSYPSIQYINLSAQLNVPLFGSHPNLSKLYSTKSGCLKILKSVAKKQKAPFLLTKSVQSIFSQKQLINSMAVLIYRNKHIKIWYLKIQDQVQSRGLAYLNINKISLLRQICSGETDFDIEQNQMIRVIAEELSSKLKHRLKIINKDIYSNYDQFLSHFLTRGGIVEAGIEGEKLTQFSISFVIDPCGQFSIIGTYNKLELGGKSINQAIKFPSTLETIDYEGITRNLYKQLWQKMKMFGYFTADFIYPENNMLPYAIGLDCFLNQQISSLFMINFCTNSRYHKDTNTLLTVKNQSFHYIYCPSITLFNLPSTSTFFKNCKFQNISFDLQKKMGTIFILLDKIQNQQLGFLCVQQNLHQLLIQARKLIEYFSKTYRQTKNSHDEIGLMKGVITTWLKKIEKKQRQPLNVQ